MSHVNQRLGSVVGLLVAGIALFLLLGANRHRVPSHKGKTLFQWAGELRTLRNRFDSSQERANQLAAAEAAIRAIGTNAIPFAWEDVSAEFTRRERLFRWISNKAPFLKFTPPKVEDRWMRGAVTLEVLGTVAKSLLPDLIVLASNRTGYAEGALLAIGPDALPAFTNLLATSTYPKTGNLIGAFANAVYSNRITPEQAAMALPSLVNVWRSTDSHGRWYAASAFGAVHQDAELCVPLLVEGISDPVQSVRESSIRSLGTFGDAASAHAGKVAEAFDQADTVTRISICSALAGFKSAQEITIPVLIRALGDTNEVVAVNAAQALGNTRDRPDLTLPALSKAVQDSRKIIRLLASQSIGFYQEEALNAVPLLEGACTDPDAGVRNAATNALRRILKK